MKVWDFSFLKTEVESMFQFIKEKKDGSTPILFTN